jgi:hypothetical protein
VEKRAGSKRMMKSENPKRGQVTIAVVSRINAWLWGAQRNDVQRELRRWINPYGL